MALSGSVVHSKPRVPKVELDEIPPVIVETITEILTECAKDETVYVKYTGKELASAGISADYFLHAARSTKAKFLLTSRRDERACFHDQPAISSS